MSSRLRSLGSTRISFFAFQDIITSVSGILILITLILSTDLEQPQEGQSVDADPELHQKLMGILVQQRTTDIEIEDLQRILSEAETAPSIEKLTTDITQLQTELERERRGKDAVSTQLADKASANESLDQRLGLTKLKRKLESTRQEMASVERESQKVRVQTADLEGKLRAAEAKLQRLRIREGKLWMIPDQESTRKRPILAIVGGNGVRLQQFDRPEELKEFPSKSAEDDFEKYLNGIQATDAYIVFLIRPSGISAFKDLVEIARKQNFAVGFDALEENREVLFQPPPPVDQEGDGQSTRETSAGKSETSSSREGAATQDNTKFTEPPKASTPTSAPSSKPPAAGSTPPMNKSWWQRLLEFIGLS